LQQITDDAERIHIDFIVGYCRPLQELSAAKLIKVIAWIDRRIHFLEYTRRCMNATGRSTHFAILYTHLQFLYCFRLFDRFSEHFRYSDFDGIEWRFYVIICFCEGNDEEE
jgi:hypothetical protein